MIHLPSVCLNLSHPNRFPLVLLEHSLDMKKVCHSFSHIFITNRKLVTTKQDAKLLHVQCNSRTDYCTLKYTPEPCMVWGTRRKPLTGSETPRERLLKLFPDSAKNLVSSCLSCKDKVGICVEASL